MHSSSSDPNTIDSISTRRSPNIPWRSMGPRSMPVSAKEYVTLERYRRNLGRPFKSTRANATAISCVILSSLLIFVGALFLVLYLVHSPVTGDWSEWSHWSECSGSCGGGERTRNRTCALSQLAPGDANCRGADTETNACNTNACGGSPQTGPPPNLRGFHHTSYTLGDTKSVYICENISQSIDVNSGSQTCPIVVYENEKWNNFSATCGEGQKFGTEVPGIGGSFFASSGYITSPNHPATFPDEYGVYHWTIVSTKNSINFHFTSFDTKKKRPDCKGTSSVAIYCGMDIPPLEPTYGYFCGNNLPKDVTCTTGCAIVRFVSIPIGSSYTGFRLEWRDED